VCEPTPKSSTPSLEAFTHTLTVLGVIPISFVALLIPISLANLTAWIL